MKTLHFKVKYITTNQKNPLEIPEESITAARGILWVDALDIRDALEKAEEKFKGFFRGFHILSVKEDYRMV